MQVTKESSLNVEPLVDWKAYATQYDLLLTFNPYYQELRKKVLAKITEWDLPPDAVIADFGAGTGNFSIPTANYFKNAKVIHIDNNSGMNAAAETKVKKLGLVNHKINTLSVEDVDFEADSLDAIISIHALYTFPNPKQVLKNMYQWLKPGGQGVLVNSGRIVNILDWQLAIGWHLVRNYGFGKAVQIMKQGQEVSRQNRFIREMQRNGTFWTHTHEEFCQSIREAGFTIISTDICFRGISDFVLVTK